MGEAPRMGARRWGKGSIFATEPAIIARKTRKNKGLSDLVILPIPRDKPLYPLLHRRLRLEPGGLLQLGRIRLRGSHVARLHREQVEARPLSQRVLQRPDVGHQLDALVIADV